MTTMPAPPEVKRLWSRATVSWMLYDLANTIFSFAITTLYFSRWVVNEMGGNDEIYGNTIALSMLVMFFTAPLLGALSDQTARRMPLLVVTTLFCVFFTALLGQGGLWPSLIFFAIANYFFQAGLIFYDALLPTVSTPENQGKVSGVGVGVGYLGSFVGLGIGSLLLSLDAPTIRIFQFSAFFFLLFALPCFLFVHEQRHPQGQPLTLQTVSAAFRAVGKTVERVRAYPGLTRFLIGRVFYTDAVNTMITFTAIYATNELAFTEAQVTGISSLSILTAIAGGFYWGAVLDRWGPRQTLLSVLLLWMGAILAGVLIPLLGLPNEGFFLVGAMAGVALSGTWAADRTLMLQLSPPEHLGQFYGLYSMVGRFGHILGPLLWGFVAVRLGLGRPAALFSLFVLIFIAYLILRTVSDERRTPAL